MRNSPLGKSPLECTIYDKNIAAAKVLIQYGADM